MSRVLEVAFEGGVRHRFSAELLRVLSPSADNAASPRGGTPPHGAKVAAGRRFVGILGMQPVGHYAVRLHFDDLHESIYPFDYLADLGQRRLGWAKSYIRLLRQQGLSRDPKRTPARKI
ncbi:hypothetical protein Rsub_11157 [Raphidocelis subcapitata]|uniref:Gamma-butyrobetaine hydroxylase-like N-terminal domain-containing protein n=1 Tax=Raphidocelis subcapitata TaxID=307507 RepID=A0A2V0PG04_9CHLO|nr:hypothetical protein Rsub_11157 [Raphidocelis subcapitata]|eukprot:GBF98751.1 hypothetical protein Rsub_11157 [Raphidocelis subcapitata]